MNDPAYHFCTSLTLYKEYTTITCKCMLFWQQKERKWIINCWKMHPYLKMFPLKRSMLAPVSWHRGTGLWQRWDHLSCRRCHPQHQDWCWPGRVQIENWDVWGNKSVMESVGPGFAFAESYACLPGEPLMVSAIAAEPSHILFLDTGRVLTTCPSACTHHNRLSRTCYISLPRKI